MPPPLSVVIPALNNDDALNNDESDEGAFVIASDPLTAVNLVNFSFPNTPAPRTANSPSRTPPELHSQTTQTGENEPLLRPAQGGQRGRKKPFYRARPLWIVPFALVASITRGMTTAPRIEVYTQLSCSAIRHRPVIYNYTNPLNSTSLLPYERHDSVTLLHPIGDSTNSTSGIMDDNPLRIPTKRCLSDPEVQAGAARLQTIMTTTAGTLSVLTTSWWGRFSERHGRTRVLAAATLGLLLTDLLFVLVSLPGSPLAAHGHRLLIVAPVIEGLLGGWSTLQSATSAYVSDCTSDGSRAQIFSRFLGVFYIGFSLGPMIGAYIITHPPPLGFLLSNSGRGGHTVAPVFWLACIGAFINFLLALFVFPESLGKEKRKANIASEAEVTAESSTYGAEVPGQGPFALVKNLFKPLAIFAPTKRGSGMDYNMTFLALALFACLLSSGVYQVRYLYAQHMYGWEAEKLSYYITFVGSARAIYLLLVLPFVISAFKPKPKMTVAQKQQMAATGKKPKPTKGQLAAEMKFDLCISRISFIIDILSNTLVSFSSTVPTSASQEAFVGFTTLSSFASGIMPSMQSLALCIMQADAAEQNNQLSSNDAGSKSSTIPTSSLFGALSVLQSGAQMILAPVLFGLVYSASVAQLPKTIFALSALILGCGLMLHSLVHPPLVEAAERKKRRKDNYLEWSPPELERGRSRVSKDLSQGFVTRTVNYGSNKSNRGNVQLRTEQFVCH